MDNQAPKSTLNKPPVKAKSTEGLSLKNKATTNKKPLIIGAVAAVAIIGSLAGYAVYARQPENIFAKAMNQNLKQQQANLSAKIAIKHNQENAEFTKYIKNINLDFTVNQTNKTLTNKTSIDPADNSDINGDLELFLNLNDADKADQYFKLNLNDKAKQELKKLIGGLTPGSDKLANLVNDKLVGDWQKVNSEEIKKLEEGEMTDYQDQKTEQTPEQKQAEECTKAISAVGYDQVKGINPGKLYKQHQYIVTESETKNSDGKRELKVTIDETKMKQYIEALGNENTELKTMIEKCEVIKAFDEEEMKDIDKDFDIYATVTGLDQIDAVKIVPKNGTDAAKNIDHITLTKSDKALNITKPAEAKSFVDFVKEFEKVMMEYFMTKYGL